MKMSDTNKQIPSPKELEDKMDKALAVCWYNTPMSNNDTQFDTYKAIELCKQVAQEYAKEVVKYTLEQAAEKAQLNIKDIDDTYFQSETFGYAENDVSIYKPSILSLEDQIIKDLKL